MIKLIYVLALLGLLAAAPRAAAQPASGTLLSEARLTYRLPAGWALKPDRSANRPCWVAVGADTAISLQLCLWSEGSELSEGFDEGLAEWNLTGPGDDGPADIELNGMEAVLAEVSQDGSESNEGLLLVCSPAEGLRVVVLGLYPDEYEAGEELIRSFIGSLQPLGSTPADENDDLSEESLDEDEDESLTGDF